MILLDQRTGSGDLAHFFASWGVAHDVCTLQYGDAAMAGQSPYDTIGVEIKKVRDALQCMCDGRFAGHQLPGLVRDYSLVWLVIEGEFGVSFDTGQMTVTGKKGLRRPLALGKRTFQYKSFDHWLLTMEVNAGIKVKRTQSRTETARFLVDLQSWWDKPIDKHKSHLAFHDTRPAAGLLVPPSLVVKIAAQLPGVGWTRAQAVGQRFETVRDMVNATASEWEDVEGIGSGIARVIVETVRRKM